MFRRPKKQNNGFEGSMWKLISKPFLLALSVAIYNYKHEKKFLGLLPNTSTYI